MKVYMNVIINPKNHHGMYTAHLPNKKYPSFLKSDTLQGIKKLIKSIKKDMI